MLIFDPGKNKDSDLNANLCDQLRPCTAEHKEKKKKRLGKKLHLVQKTVAGPINNTSCQESIIPEVLSVLAFCPTTAPLTRSFRALHSFGPNLSLHLTISTSFMSYFKLAMWRMKCAEVKNMGIYNSRILLHIYTYMGKHTKSPPTQ